MQAMPMLNRAAKKRGLTWALARGGKAPPLTPKRQKKRPTKMQENQTKNNRKSGSEARQKGAVIGFRADPVEREEIRAAAEEAGLTVGSFIRDTVLKRARTTPTKKPTFDKVLLTKLLGDLGKVGSNLNQIARRLNEGGGVGLNRINTALDEVSELRSGIIQALRRPYDNQGQEQGSPVQSGELPVAEKRE